MTAYAKRSDPWDALGDPTIRAVIAARGGYGLTRIVSRLDRLELFQPKWIVGFSDVTALHVEATARGVTSLHAPMLAWLGDAKPDARTEWLAAFEHGDYGVFSELEIVVPGDVRGTSFGGNLALLEACAAMGRLHLAKDTILFLEDCTERPYRLDRMLTSLLVGGHLRNVVGVVLGEFSDCDPGPDGMTAREVLHERLSTLGVPIVGGAPFGHGAVNRAFPIGAPCAITGGIVSF